MIHIEAYITSLKMKWIRALSDNNKASWKIIPNLFLYEYRKVFLICFCNFDALNCIDLNRKSNFYVRVTDEGTKY